MKRRTIFVGIAVVAIFGFAMLKFFQPAVNHRAMPSPNGYDDFLLAGSKLVGQTVYASDLSLEELRAYVKANQVSLDLIRAGLKKQCAVSFNRNTPAGFSAHVKDIMAVKANATLLRAEGNLAERENRFDDAAKIYFELIEYGFASGIRGVYMDRLVSRACEIMGMSAMTNVVEKLTNSEFCRSAIAKLEKMDSERESLDEMIANEKEWNRHQGLRLRERLGNFISGHGRKIDKGFRKQMLEVPLQSRELKVILAARLFELENGRSAKGFSDLVPKYLKNIPIDPRTEMEIPFSLKLTKQTDELLL